MKSMKKLVLAGLVLLASVVGLLSLVGCKNDSVPEPTRYTVKFETAHGTVPADITVESGQKATKPTDPTKANWVFAGWYTLKDDGETLADTAYNFNTPVEGDITLYAAWNGVGDDGNIVLKNKVMSKTSEVQVLSEAVDLSSLYVKDSEGNSVSQIFVDKRVDSIQPFMMGQYEVTQQLYFAVMGKWGGTEPSNTYGKGDEYPAYYVSWYDAVVFCNELTKKVLGEGACVYYSDAEFTAVYTTGDGASRKTPYMDTSKSGYRLPTEAEWELAARGGNPGAGAWKYTYAGSDTIGGVAWYNDSKTHQVGTKAANILNLYDMSGNVWEWCWDWHGSITADTPSDGAASGAIRIYRGGSWSNVAFQCRVSYLNGDYPYSRNYDLGFRLVRSAN